MIRPVVLGGFLATALVGIVALGCSSRGTGTSEPIRTEVETAVHGFTQTKKESSPDQPPPAITRMGLVQLQPETVEKAFVPAPGGILEKLFVRNGEAVKKGQILARFRNIELEVQLEEARSQSDISSAQVRALEGQIKKTGDAAERSRLEKDKGKAEGERDLNAQRVRTLTELIKGMELSAPRAGIVVGLPSVDQIGKLWEREQEEPFCSVGDPTKFRVLVPVNTAEYRSLKASAEANLQREVSICLPGKIDHTWRGKVGHLPETWAREVPQALSARFGGPIPTKPSQNPRIFVPAEEWYLVGVDLHDPDSALRPGAQAQVTIR